MRLQDGFGRTFKYLRLSVTDVCNFKCSYCLPDGYQSCGKPTPLSVDELRRAATAFSELGVSKIRLTGGEPTIRKDFENIASTISGLPHVHKLALTTNGYKMPERAQHWKKSGVSAVNVSLDSLSPENFKRITGHDRQQEVLRGIDAAFDVGFTTVKLNAVYLKGINDHEIDAYIALAKDRPLSIRFIELMETGDHAAFFKDHYVSTDILKQKLVRAGWAEKLKAVDSGPADTYVHQDYQGEFGIIAPYSKDFCKSCNRLRFSSQGNMHLCLFGAFGIPMRHLLQSDEQIPELKERLSSSVKRKDASHSLMAGNTGMMHNLSAIGG